jgi:hypothetical protein
MNIHRPLPLWKLWLFRGVSALLVLAAIEGGAAVLWSVLHPAVTWKEIREAQASLRQSGESRIEHAEAIHPYLGWVLDPNAQAGRLDGTPQTAVNELGFGDVMTSVVHREPGTKIVGVLGGSVALQMTHTGEAAFLAELQKQPTFAGQKIRLVRLAMSGYKQPQQLMALAYVLSLGGEFDYVVNLDGFNELATAVGGNWSADVAMTYPMQWQYRLKDVVDPRTTSTSFQLLANRAQRQSWATRVERSWLRHSRAVNYVWYLYDNYLWKRQVRLGAALREHHRSHGRAFARSGPPNSATTEDAALLEAVDIWGRTSQQLYRLCQGNGIRYLHVLQPNQYHLYSKPLTAHERKEFYADHEPFARAIRNGYPLAMQRAATLRAEGIEFLDLTQLFATESGEIYIDYCCHFNQRGNDLLAVRVAEALNELAERP